MQAVSNPDSGAWPQGEAPASVGAAEQCSAVLRRACGSVAQLRALIGRLVIRIDERLASQCNEVIEAPKFQALEAAWRGVERVVSATAADKSVLIKLFDQTWDELSRDLHSGLDSRRSVVYRNVVMRELDTLGGQPFGILFVNHALSLSIDDEFDEFFTGQLLCDLGAAAACPVVLSVEEEFFGETDAAWITDRRRIRSIMKGEEYRSWNALRRHPNARFLSLVWPEILLRGRYEDYDGQFAFHQWPSQSRGLWGHGGIAFLCTLIAEFRRFAWFGFLKMIGDGPGEGAVFSAPAVPLPMGTDRPMIGRIRLTRGSGQFLAEQGVIPLCESMKSHDLYFVGNRSVTDCSGNTTAEVLTQIQSVLIACRMVHYLKMLIRGLIGQIKSASECELILNNWLEQYCANVADAAPDILARYPLRSARVRVHERHGSSARFTCSIEIRPQYQVDNLQGDIALVTELRSTGQGGAR